MKIKIDYNKTLFQEFCGEHMLLKEFIFDSKKLLKETYGVYDGIYDDINKITYIIIDMIKYDKYNTEYTYDFKSEALHTNELKITLHNNKLLLYDGSEHIENGVLYLEINVGLMIPQLDTETIFDVFNKYLEGLLFHELTHSKNEIEQRLKKKYKETPEWYNAATEIMWGINDGSNVYYKFCVSLYLSYYSEIHAIMAEIISILDNKIKYNKEWKKNNSKEKINKIYSFLEETDEYKNAEQIRKFYLPIFKNFNQFDYDELKKIFGKQNYELTDKKIKDFIKQIEFGNERMLAKIRRGLNFIFKKYNLIK